MIFTTFSIFLAGIAATLIPIAIHLLSKGKPKKIVFPALRFAQAKLATNKRKLTLKRLLLLTLRVAVFLLLGLALARPYFAPKIAPKQLADRNEVAENASSNGSEDAPRHESAGISGRDAATATAIVIDTSVRMGRVRENATLFDRAIATAQTILDQTTKGSEIAILDGTYDGDAFQPDRFAAKQRLEKLEIKPSGRSAAQSTLEAAALVARSQLATREIFVLTDSTRQAWSERDVRKLRKQLAPEENKDAEVPLPTLYFVDLGDENYQDAAIVDLALSAETVSTEGTLRVDVDVERIGAKASDVSLEAVFFDPKKLPGDLTDPSIFNDAKLAIRRDKQTLSFSEGRAKRSVNFQTSRLPLGTCVGAVRIIGGDALSADDVRWFAVDVAPEWRLLVVAPEPAESKAIFATQALAPDELVQAGRAPFELDVVPYQKTSKTKKASKRNSPNAPRDLASLTPDDLERYRAVLLLDPPGLNQASAVALTKFVEAGGGLGVFLGGAAKASGFQAPEVVNLLGYKLAAKTNVDAWNVQIAPNDYNEPLLAPFRQFERMGIPWDAIPIGRFWKLTELGENAAEIAKFSTIGQGSEKDPPAIVENRLGRGLAATLATSISETSQADAWNALTSGDAAWVYVVLMDGLARRLASGSSSILNYSSGEVASLRSPLKQFPGVATIVTPQGEEISTPTDVERRQIRFPGAKSPGVYRVRTTPNRDGESIEAAFAVSTPAAEYDLTRYSEEDWEKLWEGVPYKTLDLEATGQALEAAKRSKESEPYAFLIVLLAVLFAAETGVANKFYKR